MQPNHGKVPTITPIIILFSKKVGDALGSYIFTNVNFFILQGVYAEHELLPLESLKELRLDHNRLYTLNQDLFEHTTHIEILDLSNNPFNAIDSHTVSAIDTLVLLKVSVTFNCFESELCNVHV